MFIQRLLQRFFDTDHVLGYLNIGCFSGAGCSSEGIASLILAGLNP